MLHLTENRSNILIRILNKIIRKIKTTLPIIRLKIYIKKLKKFSKKSTIKFPVCFEGKEFIEIGDDVSINAFVHIWGHGGVKIGNRVLIATQTAITSLTHDFTLKNMRFAPNIAKPVNIKDDVWIGSNAVINKGVTIGEGAVVGAGAVVTKDVPSNCIVAGNPSKIIKTGIIMN